MTGLDARILRLFGIGQTLTTEQVQRAIGAAPDAVVAALWYLVGAEVLESAGDGVWRKPTGKGTGYGVQGTGNETPNPNPQTPQPAGEPAPPSLLPERSGGKGEGRVGVSLPIAERLLMPVAGEGPEVLA